MPEIAGNAGDNKAGNDGNEQGISSSVIRARIICAANEQCAQRKRDQLAQHIIMLKNKAGNDCSQG
jgi:hypothetical protein